MTDIQKAISALDRIIWDETKERFGSRLRLWNKKLSNLDDERLYYVYKSAESILNYRAEMQRQEEAIKEEI